MPRKVRLLIPGALYHVYCRTARGERVLSVESEAVSFLGILRSIRDLHRFTVLAWCFMSNHYHLVLRTGDVPLWRTMARIQGRFAREFNRRHRYLGRLWQSRYKARVVDSERYYKRLVAYVHLNPVAAGVVTDPSNWEWSGHQVLIGRARARLIEVDQALRGFGETAGEARKSYQETVRAVAEARWLARGIRDLPWWADCEDMEEVASPTESEEVRRFDGSRLEKELPRLTVEAVAAAYARARNVSLDELQGRGKRPDVVEHRIELTLIAVHDFGHPVSSIAALLRKNPGTVSRWLGLAERRQRDEASYGSHLQEIVASMVATQDTM